MMITGHRLLQTAEYIPNSQDAVKQLHAAMFPPTELTRPVVEQTQVGLDDAELVDWMFSWKNGSARSASACAKTLYSPVRRSGESPRTWSTTR